MAVYAFNTAEQRKCLWRFIEEKTLNNMDRLLIGGDFNAVLNFEDREQGNPITAAEMLDFNICLQAAELTEIRAVEERFTWCNNQEGHRRIYSNIDRCFANIMWMNDFSQVVVERLERGVSDHCPQLLKFEDIHAARNTPFRFINVLAEHEDFEGIVKDCWTRRHHDNRMLDIWRKCKQLKAPLKKLNNGYFRRTAEQVQTIRGQLQATQKQLARDRKNDGLINEEKRLIEELEKWSTIEEKIWHQKSRVDWLKLGDANTKFFHAYVKARQNMNAIQMLKRSDGTVCYGQEQVKEEIVDFYKNLMGTAAEELCMVDKSIVARGNKLNHDQRLQLCKVCTQTEVKEALSV